MNKLFLLLALPITLALGIQKFQSDVSTVSETTTINEPAKTFGDLNDEEKAEFIKHVIETGDCEYKGIKLYGKVQFVESFPDIKIQFVESFPDIKVQFVESFPDKCGKWQSVNSFPDFKIQVVNSFPDLKVQKVTSFPGMK